MIQECQTTNCDRLTNDDHIYSFTAFLKGDCRASPETTRWHRLLFKLPSIWKRPPRSFVVAPLVLVLSICLRRGTIMEQTIVSTTCPLACLIVCTSNYCITYTRTSTYSAWNREWTCGWVAPRGTHAQTLRSNSLQLQCSILAPGHWQQPISSLSLSLFLTCTHTLLHTAPNKRPSFMVDIHSQAIKHSSISSYIRPDCHTSPKWVTQHLLTLTLPPHLLHTSALSFISITE